MFQVQGKCRSSRWRVLAERETHEEADQLYGKLRVEYGPEWMLLVVNKGDGGEGLTDMDFMLKFAGGLDGNNVSREQLRCLWTAWCLMHDVSPDTMEYDSILSRIWDEAPLPVKAFWNREAKAGTEEGIFCTGYEDGCAGGYDTFDLFMGEYLC